MRAQYAVLTKSGSKGMFVPGNHDWGGAFGPHHEAWERQTKFLKDLKEAKHSLQVLEGQKTGGIGFNLVSGAGSPEKISSVSVGKDTLFAHDHTGFMVVDFLRNGRVLLRVVEPGSGDKSVVVYQKQLRAAKAGTKT